MPRHIVTPDLAGPVAVGAGEDVTLPGGFVWGSIATLQVTATAEAPATVRGYSSPREGWSRPIEGGDLVISGSRTLHLVLTGPESARWVVQPS